MSAIRILPEKVASQIAAGEVIERPASVVRELLDNSVDAGSDRIEIKIERGGKGLIRVRDNGVGMVRDDLLLCLERHATSKIKTASELFSVKTLGFRGEALPSTASVSRLEISSRPEDQLIGHRVKVEGGKLKTIEETGCPAGTIVEVRDLFFNVPARRKFLRTDQTETGQIIDTLARIALPFLHIHFRLDDGTRTVLNLPACENHLNRLSILMGREVAGSMAELIRETSGLGIRGFVASPELTRARGDHIFIYVNNRSIRDRLVTRAVMEGYGQRLMKGRYPQVVIFLDMEPSLVDINVHPTKQEIRFHQSHLVYQTIISSIEGTLREHFQSIFEVGGPAKYDSLRPEGASERPSNRAFIGEPIGGGYSPGLKKEAGMPAPLFEERPLIKEVPQIIGQLKETYILCQTGEGLLMIDQHAAHERIVYETLRRSFEGVKIESQSFLIPRSLEFSLKEGRTIRNGLDQLAQLGLEVEHFGGNTFLLRSVPSHCSDYSPLQ